MTSDKQDPSNTFCPLASILKQTQSVAKRFKETLLEVAEVYSEIAVKLSRLLYLVVN